MYCAIRLYVTPHEIDQIGILYNEEVIYFVDVSQK